MCSPNLVSDGMTAPIISTSALMSCQDGTACSVIALEAFIHVYKLENKAIEVMAQTLEIDDPITFESGSTMEVLSYGIMKWCAEKVLMVTALLLVENEVRLTSLNSMVALQAMK